MGGTGLLDPNHLPVLRAPAGGRGDAQGPQADVQEQGSAVLPPAAARSAHRHGLHPHPGSAARSEQR